MRKIFRLQADILFTAVDVDDAFEQLELHFRRLRSGFDGDLIDGGEIRIEPVEANIEE